MTGKDTDSMTTVQMKPDYAASEVYSTASEAPPAYKRQSNSVKIAKITAFTIIVSSFILGAFILASSYLQAKASCDQVQALDSVLEKELMLETLQQVNKELPRAEALLGKENADEMDLQNLEKEEVRKVELKKQQSAPAATEEESNENDNNYSENEEAEVMKNYPGKMPLELDLSDLAAALLQNNKKSRMNCVVERKHAEEFVDSPSKTVTLPFGMNLTTDPKKARITGERISIYCESGNENKNEQDQRDFMRNNNREEDEETEEDAEPIRPMFIPYQRIPIPFGQIPQRFPLTHMPQRMMPPMMQPMQPMQHQQQPQNMMREMPPPFQHLPMRPPMPPQVMQAPHPESHNMMEQPQQQTVRIHVQQVPFREIHVADDIPMQIPAQHQELPQFQIQRLPLGVALQRAGITPDDLRNIQRMAEERITDELRRLSAEEAADSAENHNNSEEDTATETQAANEREQAQRVQAQREQAQREQVQREQAQREQAQRVQAQREQAQREQMQREQAQREQAQREQAQREQAQHEQPQREQAQQEHQQHPQPQSEEITRIAQVPPQRLILQPLPEQPRDTMFPPMTDDFSQLMQFGRAAFGRRLAQPIRIPVPMMQSLDREQSSSSESERPHFVQPRSV